MNISQDLTERERQLIEKYLNFYRSLDDGSRPARTPAQLHFKKVCHGTASPETEHEATYLKWKYRHDQSRYQAAMDRYKKGQSHYEIPEFEEGAPRDEFGSRDDYLRDRARTWNEIVRRD